MIAAAWLIEQLIACHGHRRVDSRLRSSSLRSARAGADAAGRVDRASDEARDLDTVSSLPTSTDLAYSIGVEPVMAVRRPCQRPHRCRPRRGDASRAGSRPGAETSG